MQECGILCYLSCKSSGFDHLSRMELPRGCNFIRKVSCILIQLAKRADAESFGAIGRAGRFRVNWRATTRATTAGKARSTA